MESSRINAEGVALTLSDCSNYGDQEIVEQAIQDDMLCSRNEQSKILRRDSDNWSTQYEDTSDVDNLIKTEESPTPHDIQ